MENALVSYEFSFTVTRFRWHHNENCWITMQRTKAKFMKLQLLSRGSGLHDTILCSIFTSQIFLLWPFSRWNLRGDFSNSIFNPLKYVSTPNKFFSSRLHESTITWIMCDLRQIMFNYATWFCTIFNRWVNKIDDRCKWRVEIRYKCVHW